MPLEIGSDALNLLIECQGRSSHTDLQRKTMMPTATPPHALDLETMSLEALQALVVQAEALLDLRRGRLQQSLQSDLSKLARAAGLSAEELRALFGG